MARTTFKHDETGFCCWERAPASKPGYRIRNEMVRRVEHETSEGKWQDCQELYRYLRSSVFYADGLKGITGSEVPFNIERLVNVLDELRQKEGHTLYPFVGAWNPKLQDVAGAGFERVHELRKTDSQRAARGVGGARRERKPRTTTADCFRFQEEFGHALRVFLAELRPLRGEELRARGPCREGFAGRVWGLAVVR